MEATDTDSGAVRHKGGEGLNRRQERWSATEWADPAQDHGRSMLLDHVGPSELKRYSMLVKRLVAYNETRY